MTVSRAPAAIQHAQHACQRGGEFLAVGHIAAIDVMAQAQAVFPVQNVAEAHLAQVVTALLVVPALGQFIARIIEFGRGEWIRTTDLLVPNQAL